MLLNFASEHPLYDSWIYNSSINEYICNSNMNHYSKDHEISYTKEYIAAKKFT